MLCLVFQKIGDLVEDSEKDGRGEYDIDSGSESETFDDDFIELEYEEIERGGNEDQWDDGGEKGLDLVVIEDKETGLDDEGEKRLDHSVALEDEETDLDDEGENRLNYSVAMDDEQKQAMKKLKRMDRNKWKMKKPTFEQFNMESDLRTVKLKVCQIFGNAKLFKEAAREYAINQGRSIWFPYNEKSRVQGVCKCKLDNCSWSIWASCYEKNSPTFFFYFFYGRVKSHPQSSLYPSLLIALTCGGGISWNQKLTLRDYKN
ncbi:hypothetical protein Dsin_015119 [Dipteronia sinensis]|uniref:Transposase MuDR plant domain-containing protein n=1 Tax=Dipteronia sinensis TaxID=43782 RepID=A0AAE0APB4_9ROSI|nr:hypothetical protein Dsin_015119 [Dipteronia sinensis]